MKNAWSMRKKRENEGKQAKMIKRDELDRRIESYRDDMVAALQDLVRIPSVRGEKRPQAPFGEGPATCLRKALEMAEELGLTTLNLDHYAGHAELGEGDQTIGILVHLDVVPVGENWTMPPFDAVVKEGCVWGRGACDNKAACVETLYAIKALQAVGMKWKKKVRIIFGCDEESAWEDMKYYKERVKMPDFGYVPDGNFPLTNAEKGILHIEIRIPARLDDLRIRSLQGGERPNVVLARLTMEVDGPFQPTSPHEHISVQWNSKGSTLISKGIAAHACTPWEGRSAGHPLFGFLRREGWKGNLIDFVCDRLADLDGSGLGIQCEDEESGALTMNLGTLHKEGEEFVAVVDIRYPVTADYDRLVRTLEQTAAQYGAAVRVIDHKPPLYLPKDHPLVTTLLRVYEETTGIYAQAESTGGGTYARAMDNAVAYGPGFRDPQVDHHAHNADEFIGIDEMLRACRIYAHTILALQEVTINR